eukprot:1255240-Pleurochrysis_carterae.AAC.3
MGRQARQGRPRAHGAHAWEHAPVSTYVSRYVSTCALALVRASHLAWIHRLRVFTREFISRCCSRALT